MHVHIPFCNDLPLTGTPAFSSINSHLGSELGQHDDIESLTYVLVYFLRGSLLWLGVHSVDRVLQLKQGTTMDSLCVGLLDGFRLILEHTRVLAFTQRPDYALLQSYIQDICATLPDADDTTFDWHRNYPSSPATIVVTLLVTFKGCA